MILDGIELQVNDQKLVALKPNKPDKGIQWFRNDIYFRCEFYDIWYGPANFQIEFDYMMLPTTDDMRMIAEWLDKNSWELEQIWKAERLKAQL